MNVRNFSRVLIRWYGKNARDLPWRRTSDPYKIWVSEVMLQQTTVSAVIPFYERWMKVLPSIKDAARADLQKVLKLWQGLGYYSRARNLHKSAQMLVRDFRSKIPADPQELRKLPGFGPYTVGAVLSIAFDLRVPIIDANVRRVIMRLNAWEGPADSKQDQKIYAFLDQVMPKKDLRSFNQAMMELGALVCRSQNPACLMCPFKGMCAAYRQGNQEMIPLPRISSLVDVHAAIGVISRGSKVLIQQRPPKGLFAGLWEFPGGKIEPGETAVEALRREIREEVGADIQNIRPLMQTKHYYTRFRAHLDVFVCEMQEVFRLNGKPLKWVRVKDLPQYPMPSGSAKIVDKLMTSRRL